MKVGLISSRFIGCMVFGSVPCCFTENSVVAAVPYQSAMSLEPTMVGLSAMFLTMSAKDQSMPTDCMLKNFNGRRKKQETKPKTKQNKKNKNPGN